MHIAAPTPRENRVRVALPADAPDASGKDRAEYQRTVPGRRTRSRPQSSAEPAVSAPSGSYRSGTPDRADLHNAKHAKQSPGQKPKPRGQGQLTSSDRLPLRESTRR